MPGVLSLLTGDIPSPSIIRDALLLEKARLLLLLEKAHLWVWSVLALVREATVIFIATVMMLVTVVTSVVDPNTNGVPSSNMDQLLVERRASAGITANLMKNSPSAYFKNHNYFYDFFVEIMVNINVARF